MNCQADAEAEAEAEALPVQTPVRLYSFWQPFRAARNTSLFATHFRISMPAQRARFRHGETQMGTTYTDI